MKRTKILATVAIAAVLGIVLTTTTTIGTGIFVQQANAISCHQTVGHTGCSHIFSENANQDNNIVQDGPGKPTITHNR